MGAFDDLLPQGRAPARPQGNGITQIGGADPRLPAQVEAAGLGNQQTRQQMGQTAQMAPLQMREQVAKTGLAEANLNKERAGTALTPDKLKSVRVDALNKIITARRLQNMTGDWFATGFAAPTLSKVGGSNARTAKGLADTLAAGGALAEVLKLSQATGKNPFTPMSNSDVDLISRNIANLDTGQSDAEVRRQAGTYEGAYRRAWKGAKGNDRALLDALNKLGLATPDEKRRLQGGQRPAARPAPAAQGRVIDFNDLPE